MDTDLVKPSEQSIAVREARLALKDASPENIKEIHDHVVAAEAYAKAKNDLKAYLAAGEIKLWAERSAGAVRKTIPHVDGRSLNFDRIEARRLRDQGLTFREVGDRMGVNESAIRHAARSNWKNADVDGVPLKEFEDRFDIARETGRKWERLSEIPEERFAELVEDAKQRDSALTAVGILRRDGKSYEERVESGIYRIRDGRLAIRWHKNGRNNSRTLDHGDITRARAALAKYRGKIKEEPRVYRGKTVGDARSHVVKSLQTLDNLNTKEFHPEAKEAVNRAIAHLHKAEDDLVIASLRASNRKAT